MRRLTICFLLALVCLCGCGGKGAKATSSPSPKTGALAPAFNLTAVDGSPVTFNPKQNPNDDVTLIVFWSKTWDSNAKVLLSRLGELHERYAPRGLRIIAVSYQEEPADLRAFLAINKTPFPVAVGVDTTYKKFDLKTIPTALLVDKAGKIAEKWEGHYSTEEMSTTISPYLPGRDGNSKP